MEQIPNIIQISEQTDLMQARIRLCNRFPYVIKVKAFNTVATKKKRKKDCGGRKSGGGLGKNKLI